MRQNNSSRGATMRKWCRSIHRDLSFFFSGVIIIYAVSGISLNHKREFNPHYSISRQQIQLEGTFPQTASVDKPTLENYIEQIAAAETYTRHSEFDGNRLKIFFRGGSSAEINLDTGAATYEKVRKRPVLGPMNRLHYNPSKWWTMFSDIFAVALIIITVSGVIMLKGPKSLWGRGGIELLIGAAIPILFLLFL